MNNRYNPDKLFKLWFEMNHPEDNLLLIEALPMLAYTIEGALDEACDQLGNLEKTKSKPHILDDALVYRVIGAFTKQNESPGFEKNICLHWKRENLPKIQVRKVKKLMKLI